MGCDVHTYAERKNSLDEYEVVDGVRPFDNRSYRLFGFLAGVRNYSDVTPISEPRGFPDDASAEVKESYASWESDAHTPSWLSVAELVAFNYDAICEDRRVTRQISPGCSDGGCTCEPGEGMTQTYREFLGEWFFKDLQELQDAGAERIVFWFDN